MKISAEIHRYVSIKKNRRRSTQKHELRSAHDNDTLPKITVTSPPEENIVSMYGTGESFMCRGVISVGDVERRIQRACKTVRVLPDKENKFLRRGQPSSAALDVVQDFMDAYSPENAVRVRFRPTPFDVSDMLTALGWCRAITKKEFRYLWWRSFDEVSFKTIAMRIGRSDETARARYRDALLKVWHVANTQQAIHTR